MSGADRGTETTHSKQHLPRSISVNLSPGTVALNLSNPSRTDFGLKQLLSVNNLSGGRGGPSVAAENKLKMSFSDQFILGRGVVDVGVQSSVTPWSAINKVIWPPEDGGGRRGAGSLTPRPTAACSRRVKNCLIQFRSVAQVLSPDPRRRGLVGAGAGTARDRGVCPVEHSGLPLPCSIVHFLHI